MEISLKIKEGYLDEMIFHSWKENQHFVIFLIRQRPVKPLFHISPSL